MDTVQFAVAIFGVCIPLAALIFAAISIRNQDVRVSNDTLRTEVKRLEGIGEQRDLKIMRLTEDLRECQQAKEDWMRERIIFLERLSRIERKVNGGKT